ncbi:NACHT, LRR and PYD domains-containing 14-like [Paramuricea clavata]|uniref:NACHT, LRR and PYD domains-containing 14-like n=1 Tax=Paramuricea clavata TaxID=317549 RepID=A0A7D9HBZ8_PARCT|nr:NACHT, LRR and PYD domains-containing 14-like [Paramuricea clavata]
MIDAVKDYLAPKRFGTIAYICVIVHFLCGLVFTAVTAALRASENGKFSSSVDAKSTATYKKQVDQVCFVKYDQAYNSPLPLYGFVLLSIGLSVLVSVIYSLLVWKRVDQIESSYERQTVGETEHCGQNRRIFYVFHRYFMHLAVRSLIGIIFTVVQHTYYYPNGFDLKFNCNSPPAVTSNINTEPKNVSRNLNSTSVNCENATASEKWLWGIIVSVINIIVALIILVEVIYLLPRLPVFNNCSGDGWSGDSEFVIEYLLGKPYNVPGENEPLTSVENNPPHCSTQDYNTLDSVAQAYSTMKYSIQNTRNHETLDFIAPECTIMDNDIQDSGSEDCIDVHEKYGLKFSRPRIEYLIGKQYNVPGESEPLTSIENNPPHCSTQDYSTPDSITQACGAVNDSIQDTRNQDTPTSIAQECATMDNDVEDSGTKDCIDVYKEQVLNRSRDPGIIYGPNANIDDLYIDVIIHTGRAQHKFSKEMKRHEIYDVYMKVPSKSIRLEKISDLFYPNEDTKGKFPRSILAIGRPGIGKTVLTEKILRDWANKIDEYYSDKIVFFFKFRWFNKNMNKLTNIFLKTFLRFGTGLSEENFENIYEQIAKEPQKAILIFDGLDEYHGDPISCLDQSRIIPNDPDNGTSAMNLFIKLVLGDLLKGATVVVTSRPIGDGFYSRLNFDRNVEIIGFTSNNIEKYVSRFCDNNNMRDLKTKLWNHITSSSELLNLCYIPVNCFIVCVTLSGYLSDTTNETGALPTTLTELYQSAIDHFEKHHHRNADRNIITEMQTEALKKLQRLAFLGMESRQLIFDQVLFDEEMKTSGLLNSLSNPIFPIQTQFCFIHLTIQEFLAARHVTETRAPPEIQKFISDHVKSGKWHLVLQFIAGLLGKKIKNFDWEYKDCVFAFAESLKVTNGKIQLNYQEVFIMKCLREADNEEITKEVCETTAMNDSVELLTRLRVYNLSPSEWAAVTFVCKHMKKLAHLILLEFASDCLPEIFGLLQWAVKLRMHLAICGVYRKGRDVKVALYYRVDWPVFFLPCERVGVQIHFTDMQQHNHEDVFEQMILNLKAFFSHHILKRCAELNNEHCQNLTRLDLGYNSINDESELTDQCITTLVKALQDERCHLNDLSLQMNFIGDKGASTICRFEDTLTKEHCKLTKLNFDYCRLTDQCISSLCKALQDEHCQLTFLTLSNNDIGDEGACMLFEDSLTKDHCKLIKLELNGCSLTDQCIPSLCKALKNGQCVLTKLSLTQNKFTENGKKLLRDTMNYKSCEARGLQIVCKLPIYSRYDVP